MHWIPWTLLVTVLACLKPAGAQGSESPLSEALKRDREFLLKSSRIDTGAGARVPPREVHGAPALGTLCGAGDALLGLKTAASSYGTSSISIWNSNGASGHIPVQYCGITSP